MTQYTTSESAQEIPYGYCHCGCGERTAVTKQAIHRSGYKKDEPYRYIYGHRKTVDVAVLFWDKVSKSDSLQCWLWTGCQNGRGYGYFKFQGKDQLAHRVSYQLSTGPIPDGLFVCHTCDCKLCVNPDHLFLGTHDENMADCVAKGRNSRGETHVFAKLTESQVLEIRAKYATGSVTQKALASEFGIIRQTVSDIVLGRRWKHLQPTTR